jgi:t-SNARE complex subunit (syntaxin)
MISFTTFAKLTHNHPESKIFRSLNKRKGKGNVSKHFLIKKIKKQRKFHNEKYETYRFRTRIQYRIFEPTKNKGDVQLEHFLIKKIFKKFII